MAGTISGLRFQKATADRVNIYLDGQFAFGLPALKAAALCVGQFLSDGDIAALQETDRFQKTYDRAVRFLSYRPRSTAEVQRHLAGAEDDEDVIAAVIARLSEQGYLNDPDFARFWVENRVQFRPKGPRALRQELRQHGLGAEAIEHALVGVDAAENAYAAARPRALRLAVLAEREPAAFRQKLHDFLARRGFDYDIIRSVIIRLSEELSAAQAETEDQDT